MERFVLNILNDNDGTWHGKWQPTTTIPEILLAVQTSLNEPNPNCPARADIHEMFVKNRKEYDRIFAHIKKNKKYELC